MCVHQTHIAHVGNAAHPSDFDSSTATGKTKLVPTDWFGGTWHAIMHLAQGRLHGACGRLFNALHQRLGLHTNQRGRKIQHDVQRCAHVCIIVCHFFVDIKKTATKPSNLDQMKTCTSLPKITKPGSAESCAYASSH